MPFSLDVRTLLVLLVVASTMMTIMVWVGISDRASGLRRWNVSLGMISFSCALFALRGIAPDLLTMPFANALLLTALMLQGAALLEFRGRPPGRWMAPTAFAATFALLFPLMGDFPRFTALTSALYCTVCVGIAVIAFGIEAPSGRSRWLLVGMFLAAAAALAARTLSVVVNPAGYPSLMSPQPVQQIALAALFCAIVGGSFAFLLLHRDRVEAEMRRLATTDGLTGLLNRRAFMDQAERELARARRMAVPYAVLMMDLDHFKRVNDAHGHQAGDRVLADFARRLEACLRAEDLLGRYGGEEFCAILPGTTPERALEIGERIRAAVLDPALGGLAKPVSVSVGVAVCQASDPSVTLDHAISRADVALYDAKRHGRNRVAQVPCQPAAPALSLAA